MNILVIGGASVSCAHILAALGSSRMELLTIAQDHRELVIRPVAKPEPPQFPLEAFEAYALTASSCDYVPEHEPVLRHAKPRAHWQRNDRLPFYAGIRSRKQRR